ncbi:zinc finger CCCH domain-containing protein 33-like [Canna indica]|uniref:Zinc finger CCCH domain-containing protein 33-like n=1 Tax=Canna indica TaxID=4628 RepID=A0AAQ3JQG4_9LILI|nr:zinc finger CCCH domain-containing protein 33-like [Canna indica]
MPGTRHNTLCNSASSAPPDNLEEAMKHLKIESKGGPEGSDDQLNTYPCRPGEPDCNFYLRTGLCSYGSKCRYNHPTPAEQETQQADELPQRDGQPDCQFFLKTGSCKYGRTCKYHHPQDRPDAELLELNVLGLPMRKDAKLCSYFMKTGSCKFGATCKFNHPQPASVGTAFPASEPSVYEYDGSYGNRFSTWTPSNTAYMTNMQGIADYMPVILPPNQATISIQQASSNYMGSQSVPATGALGLNDIFNSKHHSQPGSSMAVFFPERPDQPECQYYMKTGRCKFGNSCKYHHPKERNQASECTIGPFGLPLRPGQSVCTFYATYGFCKYGASCKFDHPYAPMYAMPEASMAILYPTGTGFTWMPQENSSFSIPKAPEEFMPSMRIKELHDADDNEHENTEISPTHTAPNSESSVNQSDEC